MSFLTILMTSSCVKESRMSCPCYLYFGHDGFDKSGYEGDVALYILNQDRLERIYTYDVMSLINDECDVGVERGYIDVCGICGLDVMSYKTDNTIILPQGYEYDPIYAFYDDVSALGERAPVFGTIHKQFATINIGIETTDESMPLEIHVSGNSCGMDIKTMDPIPGPFSCIARNLASRYFAFRVPRQFDNSLSLEIWQKSSDGNDIRLSVLNIGQIITDRLGYDWDALSLADIDINVDYSISVITIQVKEWNLVELYKIEV